METTTWGDCIVADPTICHKYHEARMDPDKEIYERQIKIVDSQIDQLVYDLYRLIEAEIKVVEGATK